MNSIFFDGFVNPYNQTPRDVREDIQSEYIMEDEFCFYESSTDDIIFIKESEKARPDLISYRVYGNPLFDWVIMRRNAILYPNELTPGMMLYIPKLTKVISNGSPLIP